MVTQADCPAHGWEKPCEHCATSTPAHDVCLDYLGHAVLVEWQDSTAMSGWHPIDTTAPATIRSVGIMTVVNPGHITLAGGISISGRVHDQLIIPRGCIITAHVLTAEPIKQPE